MLSFERITFSLFRQKPNEAHHAKLLGPTTLAGASEPDPDIC